jgi:hypothetical protein
MLDQLLDHLMRASRMILPRFLSSSAMTYQNRRTKLQTLVFGLVCIDRLSRGAIA